MNTALYAAWTALTGLWLVLGLVALAFTLWLLYRLVCAFDDLRFLAQQSKRLHGGTYRRTPVLIVFAAVAGLVLVAFLCCLISVASPSSAASVSTF